MFYIIYYLIYSEFKIDIYSTVVNKNVGASIVQCTEAVKEEQGKEGLVT